MNNPRRKTIQALMDQLIEVKDNLATVVDEEFEYRDNMPENLQGSTRYEKAEIACDILEEAVSQLEEAIGSLYTAME